MAGIDIAAFEERLIQKRAAQYVRDHKFSEVVAYAAAKASVEETLNQPYEVKDSFFEGLSEDRQIGIIQILKANLHSSTTPSKKKAIRGGGKNLGVAKAHWYRGTNYGDEKKLDAFVRKAGFESFEEFYNSPGYKQAQLDAKAAKH